MGCVAPGGKKVWGCQSPNSQEIHGFKWKFCVRFARRFSWTYPWRKTSPACILYKTHNYSSDTKHKNTHDTHIHIYIYRFINKFITKYLHQYFNYKKRSYILSDSDRSHPQGPTILKHTCRVLVWLFTVKYDRPWCTWNVYVSDFPLHLYSKKFYSLRMLGYSISNF